jgi:hypothetical protein
MPTTFWRKRELPPPKNTLQFKRFEDIREVLIEAKADVILADWSHIKRQVGAFVFGKAKEWLVFEVHPSAPILTY